MARRAQDLSNGYAVTLRIVVPPRGLGNELGRAVQWINKLDAGNATHGGGAGYAGQEIKMFHFLRLADAVAFVAEFPEFELVDGSKVRGWPG